MSEPTDETKRVLLVDDDEAVRVALKRTLRPDGYLIECLPSAQEALELMPKFRPHLVISDHLMPNMTGLQFLRLVRTRYPDTIRILVTAHAESQVAIDAINSGELYRFITKPWAVAEVRMNLHLAFEHLAVQVKHRRILAMARRMTSLIDSERPNNELSPATTEKILDLARSIAMTEEDTTALDIRPMTKP